jgi:hypothetical protein
MVTNLRMVADMIPAPQCNIVTYQNKWLDGIVLQNKTVIANLVFIKDSSF